MQTETTETDAEVLAGGFHDEAEMQRVVLFRLQRNRSISIRVFPFLLSFHRSIESVLQADLHSSFQLILLYKQWRSMPRADKKAWKDVSKELILLQFSKEAHVASKSGYGKCKLKRLRDVLLPLRELIPDFVVSEAEFIANPFCLFKCTCLSNENIWVQPPSPDAESIDSKLTRRLLSTKRSPAAVIHKLELVKVCAMAYVRALVQKPSMVLAISKVFATELNLAWTDNTLLMSFESLCQLSTRELQLRLDQRIRRMLEPWDLLLYSNMRLKAKAVHASVHSTLSETWSEAGSKTEVMTVLDREKTLVVFVLQEERKAAEARSMPWGVVLVAM